MPSSFSFRLLLLAAVLAAPAPAAWARTWTNHEGKQIEADYVRLDGQNVVLLMKGREFSVPLIQLSASDKQYVFQRAAGIAEAPTGNPPAGDTAGEQSSSPDDEADTAEKSEDSPRRSDAARGVARIREWTDDQGNTIRAKFIRVHEENVILMQGRKVVPCPLAKLSAADQDYLRELLEARGEEHLMPSPDRLASNGQGEFDGGYSTETAGRAMAGGARFVPPGMAGGYSPPVDAAGSHGEEVASVGGYSPPMEEAIPSGHDADTGYTPPSFENAATSGHDAGGYVPPGMNDYASSGHTTGGYQPPGMSNHASSGHDAGGYEPPGMPNHASSGHGAGAGGYGGSSMGSDIASASMPPPSMPSAPTFEWVHECSQCGKQVSESDRSCPHCGVRFINAKGGGGSYASNDSSSNSSGSSFRLRGRGAAKLIGLAITGLLVVIGAIARVLGVGSDR